MNLSRVHTLKKSQERLGTVVYWMSRDQRVFDNWAIIYARCIALEKKSKLAVVFNIADDYLFASVRHWDFMLAGLKELEETLNEKNIPFFILLGKPSAAIPKFLKERNASDLIVDFDPLNIKKAWIDDILADIDANVYEVDAHNIVPCRIASGKQEYSAYTLRKKIGRVLFEYLEEYPSFDEYPHNPDNFNSPPDNFQKIDYGRFPKNPGILHSLKSGESEAHARLKEFIENRLSEYAKRRNEPSEDFQSGLSPYLHFGQISSQRIALEVKKSSAVKESADAFLEELIIRKELSDNFCHYNKNYMNFQGFPAWAVKTLNKHRNDKRPYLYMGTEFENAETHDLLWNCAQRQLLLEGKMHGYMRMYWAKKILEWTESPEEAMTLAVYLNDKYSIDGRDPNGYAGIAWCIGGVHDRPWQERPVFGMIRYMSGERLLKKYNMKGYIDKYAP